MSVIENATSEKPEAAAPLLELRGLSTHLGSLTRPVRAVDDVSLRIHCGETFVLLGESGCGKSLSALAIMDLLPPLARRRADRLLFEDTDLVRIGPRDMADIRGQRMAMIFQEPMTSLNPCYTIGNQLVEALRHHRSVSTAGSEGVRYRGHSYSDHSVQ